MATIRTIFATIYVWLGIFIGGISFLIPIGLIKIVGTKAQYKKWTSTLAGLWTTNMLWALGMERNVLGKENIPNHDNICIVSNHQTTLDFLFIVSAIPKMIGFITKKELLWVPVMNLWMLALNCGIIDRSKKEQALKVIRNRVEKIKDGFPMLIFPEGTRSHTREMNKFKQRGLQVIVEAGVIILPITVIDSYQRFAKGKIYPGKLTLQIHPPIDSSLFASEERDLLIDKIAEVIGSSLK